MLFTVLLLFNASIGAQAQIKKNIQLVFNPNEQFEFRNTLNTEVFKENQQLAIKQINHFTLALHIIGKDTAGKVMIQAKYIKNGYKNEDIAKKEITGYNSDSPDEFINASRTEDERSQNQTSKELLEGMLHKPFTIYINERSGRVVVTGIDTLVTEALKGLSISDPQYREGYGQGIRTVYNNEMMAGRLVSAFNYIPGKPVNIAAGWTKNVGVEGILFKVGYAIKSMQPDSISILAEPSPLVNTKIHISTSRKGNLTIDAKTGLLIRSSIRNEIKPSPDNGRQFLNVLTEENELVRIK